MPGESRALAPYFIRAKEGEEEVINKERENKEEIERKDDREKEREN